MENKENNYRKNKKRDLLVGKILFRICSEYQASGSVTEGICRGIFQHLTGKFFHSVRPDFLRNPLTNYCLELDGYCEELQIAFEYNGIQHYKFPNKFHKTEKEFLKQISHDVFKAEKCKEMGINLIIIPYTVKRENLDEFIRKNLKKLKVMM